MRTGKASRHERLLTLFERNVRASKQRGLSALRVEDRNLDGAWLTTGGRRLVNFGSCAYMGLNTDPRLKAAAKDAIDRFGPVFSSSTAYTSIGLYTELEERLKRIFHAHVVVPPTTTLGHLAALPVLIGEGDAVLVDSQAHSTVHLATQILMAEGISVTPVAHNDMEVLTAAVEDACSRFDQVWYIADGIYSMLGDVAPVAKIMDLVERHDNLHVYFDDAHGFGWRGINGRGWVLDAVPWHPRMVVAVSLAKSFGSGGAALAFPDAAMAERVQLSGGTMVFSGPLHPAQLGAAIASADIHLSPELEERQAVLDHQIRLMRAGLLAADLPVVNTDATPLWFVRVGGSEQTLELGRSMMDDGFYLNFAAFPAVPVGQAGLRLTHTVYHTGPQIEAMIESLARNFRAIAGKPEILFDISDHAMKRAEAS
jgi:7-keto-8-aminopelargonate synthetase-like enzyme